VAIEGLYVAFADIPAPTTVDHCDCCMSADDVDALLVWPDVHTVPAELLRTYAWNLLCGTVGSPEDAHHFAPRLLEVALDPGAWPDLDTVCRTLGHYVTGWSRAQRDALDGFARALWRDRLTSDPSTSAGVAHDLLRTLSHLTYVAPLLDLWTDLVAEPHPAAHLQVLIFWRWFDPETVATWLCSDRLLDAVRATGDPLLLEALLEERARQQ